MMGSVHYQRNRLILLAVFFLLVGVIGGMIYRAQRNVAPVVQQAPESTEPLPELITEAVVEELNNPWDIGFLPDETLLFTERAGQISKIKDGKKVVLATVPNVFAKGEGGLLGLAIDPEFANNRFIYACYDTPQDIRLSRWKVNADVTALTEQTNIITGMPVNTKSFPGRHSGCRPRFGADGYLWVGTGDVAGGTNPQDPRSLGGKILRVTRDGQPAPGNLNDPFDRRIYSYGHRNVQGLAMLSSPKYGVYGFSVEHGPTRDDEVTPLRSGNMGWNPVPGYNENVPMTDKTKFPDAVEPIWRSGNDTIAPSGMTFLTGSKWQGYNGWLVMAVLKGEHVRLLELDSAGKLKSENTIFQGTYGRVRSAVMGPNNDLYLSTDNGDGKDQIIKVTPR